MWSGNTKMFYCNFYIHDRLNVTSSGYETWWKMKHLSHTAQLQFEPSWYRSVVECTTSQAMEGGPRLCEPNSTFIQNDFHQIFVTRKSYLQFVCRKLYMAPSGVNCNVYTKYSWLLFRFQLCSSASHFYPHHKLLVYKKRNMNNYQHIKHHCFEALIQILNQGLETLICLSSFEFQMNLNKSETKNCQRKSYGNIAICLQRNMEASSVLTINLFSRTICRDSIS